MNEHPEIGKLPECKLLLDWCGRYYRWFIQGQPRDVPVLVRLGTIKQCPVNHYEIANWSWDFYFMKQSVEITHWSDIMSAVRPDLLKRITSGECKLCL